MERLFRNMYTAVCASGFYRYIDEFYDEKAKSHDPNIVNMQIRYWLEAVEKYYNLTEDEYDEEILEEGILIVNCLANSLLILGGVNWKGKGRVPYLLQLYDGDPFPLRKENPDLFDVLVEINGLYNKLSKHFCKNRVELFQSITYANLKRFFEATREIWLWVCHSIHNTDVFDLLFSEPMEILRSDV